MTEHIDDHMLYNNPLVKLSLKPPLWRIFLAINGRQITLILSLFLAFASSSTVKAEQWLFDEPLRWDAHFIFDGSWRDSETNAGNSYSSESIRYRERFSFKKRLYILDPGILRLDFHASPTFSQSSILDASNTTDESDSVSWDYSANSSLFHGTRTPLSLTAGIGKTTGISNGILGARTDFEMKNQQVTARLKNRFFPSLISYTTRDQDQTLKTNFSATPWRTNDSIKRLSYAGRSSKMNLNIEQVDYNDYIYGRNYRYNSERLTHAFKWGKKSSLHSRLEHREQNGLGDYQQTSITENVRLQHTQQLFSSYMYAYDKTEQNSDKTSHRSSIDINHTLYTNLTTQAGYSQNLDRYSTGGKTSTTGPNYSVSYNKKLPMKKSNISLGFNGARISTEQVGGTQLIDVINDANIFVADRIILSQQYIDISTIQVFNSTTGAPYDENTDYTITQAASGFTEIYRVISGGIIPNEDVNVNFSRWVPGNVSRRNAYFFRFSIDNFQLYYNQTKNNQSLNLGSANVTVPSNFSPGFKVKFMKGEKVLVKAAGDPIWSLLISNK